MSEMKDRLHDDMVASMKARDKDRTRVLRAALAAITNAEVAGKEAHELTAAEELKVVIKQERQRRDSAEEYAKAGRDDLAEVEVAEAEILAEYLPTPLTDDELNAIVDEEIAKVPDASMKQMGAIVKAVNARAEGRADGGAVAKAVKAKLMK